MKKKYLVFVLISLSEIIKAQTTTVTEKWCGTTGSLTTTTIIHEGNRVYHGAYSFNGSRPPQEGYSKGIMTIKGSRKYGLMDGDFSMTYMGGHFTGELDFKIEGKLSERVMVGTWNVKSKCRNIDAYNNDKYTYDKSYTLVFDDKGQLIAGTRKNNASGSIVKFQTDENGYLHGKQSTKFDDGGFLSEEVENYFHGILMSKEKRDVKTNQILGTIKYFADTTIVNEKNYLKNENAFNNSKYADFADKHEKLKDSLEHVNALIKQLKNSNDYIAYNENIEKKKYVYDSLGRTEQYISSLNFKVNKYKLNENSEKLYSYLRNGIILEHSEDSKKTVDKIFSNYIESKQITAEDKCYFFNSKTGIVFIKISKDGVVSELQMDKKTLSGIEKISNASQFHEVPNQTGLILELSGLDEAYFIYKNDLDVKIAVKNELQVMLNKLRDESVKLKTIVEKISKLELLTYTLEDELSSIKNLLNSETKF